MINDLENFVVSLNRENCTVEEVVDAIRKKENTLTTETGRYVFRDIVYNELWVAPASLMERRLAGELDSFFKG